LLSTSIKYRPEIDGLRAIAVLPVILFHAGVDTFSGGYVGVDIFFVISGYLITSILLHELQEKNFSVINFYERRARRILPALFLVLLVCLPFSWMLMTPADLISFSKSVISVIFYASNVFFFRTLDYFSPNADTIPLLHTWSLGIEEQFYILFPVLLLLIWRVKRDLLPITLIALSITSLTLCLYFSTRFPDFNFYLLPSRAWELMAGSTCAYFYRPKKAGAYTALPISEALALLGLVLIFVSIVTLDENTPYPGVWTLLPVIGTVLVILHARENSVVARTLGVKGLVWTGLLSYSAYLWHQPVFSFYRMYTDNSENSGLIAFALILIVFVLSYLSWAFVEKPFRDRKLFNRKRVFSLTILGSLAFLIVGSIGILATGFTFRYANSVNELAATAEISPKRNQCHTSGARFKSPEESCSYFEEEMKWAMLGDSHGVELAYALSRELEKENIGLKHFTFSSCAPEILFRRTTVGCASWLSGAIEWLSENPNTTNVVLAFYHLTYENMDLAIGMDNRDVSEKNRTYYESFETLVTRLRKAGKTVYIVLPIPRLEQHIDKYTYPSLSFFGASRDENKMIGIDAKNYFNEANTSRTYLTEIARKTGSILIDPSQSLCDESTCYGMSENKLNYFDQHHLSVHGAEKVADQFSKLMESTSL
jgi:peptidoglycan/LPS O-acetylase OafA/YrhL